MDADGFKVTELSDPSRTRGTSTGFLTKWSAISPFLAAALPLLFMVGFAIGPMLRLAWEGLDPSALPEWAAGQGLSPADVGEDEYLRFRLLWSLAQASISVALKFGIKKILTTIN